MALLKYLAKSIDVENEVEEKKYRQLRTNPNSKPFSMKFPIVVENCYDGFLIDKLARACREIGERERRRYMMIGRSNLGRIETNSAQPLLSR